MNVDELIAEAVRAHTQEDWDEFYAMRADEANEDEMWMKSKGILP